MFFKPKIHLLILFFALSFLAILPDVVFAGLSEGCNPAVSCPVGNDYYAGQCKKHIENIGDCGVPVPGNNMNFSCGNGCYQSKIPDCPGGQVKTVNGCKTVVQVVADTVFKIWDGAVLKRIVYIDDAACTDGQVAKWDNVQQKWTCGAAGSSQWITDGNDIFYNAGAVGIGNGSPSDGSKFAVHGDVSLSSPAAVVNIIATNNPLAFQVQYLERLRIEVAGNVGIGTATPKSKLDVEGNAAIGRNYSGSFAAPNDGLIIEGRVGIGTEAPSNLLTVNGQANFGGLAANSGTEPIEVQGLGAGVSFLSRSNNSNRFVIYNEEGKLRFWESGDRMAIEQTTGNVGIGTSSPGYRLDVVGRARFQSNGDTSGFWLMNNANNLERAFIGMANDNEVGFWGNGGADWFFKVNVNDGTLAGPFVGTLSRSKFYLKTASQNASDPAAATPYAGCNGGNDLLVTGGCKGTDYGWWIINSYPNTGLGNVPGGWQCDARRVNGAGLGTYTAYAVCMKGLP